MTTFHPRGTGQTAESILELLNEQLVDISWDVLVKIEQLTNIQCQRIVDMAQEAADGYESEENQVEARNVVYKKEAIRLANEIEYPSSSEFTDDWQTLLHIINKPAFIAWMKESDEGEMGTRCVDNARIMIDAAEEIEGVFDSMAG